MKNNGKKTTINTPGGKKKKQKDPGNRSRTSDLEISVVAIYSLPLCQLSYTRIVEDPWEQPDLYWCLMKVGTKKKMVQSVGIEPTLLRTRALSVRLNRSAKTAVTLVQVRDSKSKVHVGYYTKDFMAQWQRVGFQTRRLGVRFPLRSFAFFNSWLVHTTAHTRTLVDHTFLLKKNFHAGI